MVVRIVPPVLERIEENRHAPQNRRPKTSRRRLPVRPYIAAQETTRRAESAYGIFPLVLHNERDSVRPARHRVLLRQSKRESSLEAFQHWLFVPEPRRAGFELLGTSQTQYLLRSMRVQNQQQRLRRAEVRELEPLAHRSGAERHSQNRTLQHHLECATRSKNTRVEPRRLVGPDHRGDPHLHGTSGQGSIRRARRDRCMAIS